MPSWRFFDEIAPSPRIEYRQLQGKDEKIDNWQNLSIRPEKISPYQTIFSLFHNPQWNNYLYINSCAENLMQEPSVEKEQELAKATLATIKNTNINYFQFRLLFICREGQELKTYTGYISKIYDRGIFLK